MQNVRDDSVKLETIVETEEVPGASKTPPVCGTVLAADSRSMARVEFACHGHEMQHGDPEGLLL